MRLFQLVKTLDGIDLDKYLPELTGTTLVLFHDFYDVKTSYQKLEWSKFKASYTNYEPANLIIVGMNRIRTAETRYDLVYSYIYRMNQYDFKAVFDERPFTGEPWRLWYPFGFLYGKWLDVDHSNPLETEWLKWFFYDTNFCRLDYQNMKPFIKDTRSELDKLVTQFNLYESSEIEYEYYEETKKIVFEKYNTPRLLTNNLLKHCNRHFSIDIDFESYRSNKSYNLPDFGVYRYLVEENKRRMNIYNCFTHEVLQQG
jgi:hypothetical protein